MFIIIYNGNNQNYIFKAALIILFHNLKQKAHQFKWNQIRTYQKPFSVNLVTK